MAVEQAQRMAAHDHQSLLVGHDLQILLDETILHPVLADLTGFAVGHQFVGIQSHVKVQIVLNHYLKRLALNAVALVLIDRFAGQAALRTETVSVNPAVLLQLLSKLLGHLGVMVGMDVAQGIFDCQFLVSLRQMGLPAGSAADPFLKCGILRQIIVQLYRHSLINIKIRHGRSS